MHRNTREYIDELAALNNKSKIAVSYDKHYIHDPYTPREYGRDDAPNLLDQVADDVEQHARGAGRKLLNGVDLHPKSYSRIADTFDHMTRETLLRIGNNYGDEFEGIQGREHQEFTKEAADIAENGKYFHRKDYGMENPDEIRRPQTKGEELGEALMEPFRRQKEQEMADVPREDFITGNRLIEKFSRELYGKAYKSLKSRGSMLGAKITNLQPTTGAGVHAVIDSQGNLLEKDGSDHFDLTREHLNLHTDSYGNRPDITDEQVHQMLRDNDLVRIQNFTKSRDPHISVHLAKPANQHQMKKIKEIFEDNPYISIGYFMGHTADSAEFGSADSFNEFRLKHTEAFSGKPSSNTIQ